MLTVYKRPKWARTGTRTIPRACARRRISFTVFFYGLKTFCCKTAQVGETPRESVCLAPPLRMRAWSCSIRSLFSARSFVSAVFNGEFGNSRDASVHTDGAKSRCPKRVARALRRRNSLHMAIQIWGGACPRYHFGDCGPHSAQTEQSGETASLTSL
jgi:hypothetical protein